VMDTENVEIIKAMVRTGIGSASWPSAIAREVQARQLSHPNRGLRALSRHRWVYARANRTRA